MRLRAKRRTTVAGLIGALGLALAVSACGPTTVVAPTPTVTGTIMADKGTLPAPATTEAPPPVWPLTGVPGETVERPAVSVKIENLKDARPQAGLEAADIVWEEVVEGGITRFVVMYHSQQPELVGPVRSVRPMDGPIAGPTHGLLAFSGGQPVFVDAALAAGLQVISQDLGSGGFHVDKKRKAPHNTFGSVPDFAAQADADHQVSPAPQFTYAASAAESSAGAGGVDAAHVSLVFSSYAQPGWTWDAGTGTWLRDEKGTSAVVAAGWQISAVNVVVLRVDTRNTGVRDPAGTPVPETIMVGSGTGHVLVGGKVLDVTWSKADDVSPVVLAAADGSPVTLAPGNTWVELVPNSGSVTLG